MEHFIDWVASYPKSGNTWVRALLNAYYYGKLFHPNNMDIVCGEPHKAYYNGLWTSNEPWDLYDWACMRNVALCQMHELKPINHFVLKTHTANVQIHDVGLISERYTRRAVYVVRDPRDVLVSSSKYFRNSPQEQWRVMQDANNILGEQDSIISWQPTSSWEMHVKSWLTETRFPVLKVRYEDLIADTAGEFAKILDFFGIEKDMERVRLAVELSSFKAMRQIEQELGFKDNLPMFKNDHKGEASPFFRVGKCGQWRTELTPKLAKEVANQLGSLYPLWGKTQTGSEAA